MIALGPDRSAHDRALREFEAPPMLMAPAGCTPTSWAAKVGSIGAALFARATPFLCSDGRTGSASLPSRRARTLCGHSLYEGLFGGPLTQRVGRICLA
ncbi:MAG: hypothetical protein WCF81_18300 [Roseiarcus sp.]